jgi:hypothetical protein
MEQLWPHQVALNEWAFPPLADSDGPILSIIALRERKHNGITVALMHAMVQSSESFLYVGDGGRQCRFVSIKIREMIEEVNKEKILSAHDNAIKLEHRSIRFESLKTIGNPVKGSVFPCRIIIDCDSRSVVAVVHDVVPLMFAEPPNPIVCVLYMAGMRTIRNGVTSPGPIFETEEAINAMVDRLGGEARVYHV